jgi:hypothetical protein
MQYVASPWRVRDEHRRAANLGCARIVNTKSVGRIDVESAHAYVAVAAQMIDQRAISAARLDEGRARQMGQQRHDSLVRRRIEVAWDTLEVGALAHHAHLSSARPIGADRADALDRTLGDAGQ